MFAMRKYRDLFSHVGTGFPPSIYNSVTASGQAVLMGGSTGRRKLIYRLIGGSSTAAVGQMQLLLYACSASTGAGMTLLGTQSSYPVILGSVASTSGQVSVIELRGEYLESNSVGPYVIPLFSGSGAASHYFTVTCEGFSHASGPALNYDSASYVKGEYDLL